MMQKIDISISSKFKYTVALFLTSICSMLTVKTMLGSSDYFITLILSLFSLAVQRSIIVNSNRRRIAKSITASPRSAALLLSLSVLFSIATLYSSHLNITGSLYSGTMAQNTLRPFSWFDILNFTGVLFISFLLLFGLVVQIQLHRSNISDKLINDKLINISSKSVLKTFIVIIVCWLPYLFAYWPGLIYGDTTSSFYQILNDVPLNNHHPVAFTVSLGFFINVANALGYSETIGVAAFTLMQMTVFAGAIAYSTCWLRTRCKLNKSVYYLIVFCVGGSAYLASYSISLWKDPIFSASLSLSTILLTDCVLTNGKTMTTTRMLQLSILLITTCLYRNNGIYVVCIGLVFIIMCLVRHREQTGSRLAAKVLLAPFIFSIACTLFITGPIYSKLGVEPTEPAETLGIPLNQMARVVALNGRMNSEDKEFMNEILPLEQYKDKYRPSCTDMLKWDPMFNSKPLNSSSFFKRWIHMFINNPKTYLDSWVYQTFGFWSPCNEEEVLHDGNFTGGMPINIQANSQYGKIKTRCLLPISDPMEVFPIKTRCFPAGILFWLILVVLILVIYFNCGSTALPIFMILGLYASLFAASPIWYWPRYIAAAQLAIPCYIVIIYFIYRGYNNN